MATRGSSAGYTLLAVISVLIGGGGLLAGLSQGRIDSLVLGLVHLPVAYGLWRNAPWGGHGGILAYGIVGGTVTVLRGFPDPIETSLALIVAVSIVGYIVRTEGWQIPVGGQSIS